MLFQLKFLQIGNSTYQSPGNYIRAVNIHLFSNVCCSSYACFSMSLGN